eukprot:jgi/Mesen1/8592/ME000005S08560
MEAMSLTACLQSATSPIAARFLHLRAASQTAAPARSCTVSAGTFRVPCQILEQHGALSLKGSAFSASTGGSSWIGHALSNFRVGDRQRRRRNNSQVVAASPPAEELVVRTEPLTKEDLVNYLKSGCKPPERWRIGTEHEKFGFNNDTLAPVSYAQISQLLTGISERFGWRKIMEGDNVIGLTFDGQSVSLEPGGQFELSGAPLETVHQTCAEVNSHLYQVKAVAEELGIGFIGLGFDPQHKLQDIPIMPKGRYTIMRNYMPKVGTLGLEMMFRTCTVQDMIDKFRVGLALQPIATALFANSPFTEGKPNGYLSYRSHIWEDTDNHRTGDLPFVFEPDFGFEKYVEYALNVPMYFVYRNHQYIDASGLSFKDFLEGKLPVLPGEYPTMVRLKRFLEMRGADGGPWRRLCALPAFWVGLLYDRESLAAALELVSDWTERERAMLRVKVPKQGLKTPFRDATVRHIAQDVLRLSREGLERRGFKEASFLNELRTIAEKGVTPAERLLELYNTKWDKKIEPIYRELLY